MIRAFFSAAVACLSAGASELRVEVDGVGCHTRQLAVRRIWSALPEVTSVEIVPRGPADPANRRVFVITGARLPDQASLESALGDRTRFYKILSVSPVDLPNPALSKPTSPDKVHP